MEYFKFNTSDNTLIKLTSDEIKSHSFPNMKGSKATFSKLKEINGTNINLDIFLNKSSLEYVVHCELIKNNEIGIIIKDASDFMKFIIYYDGYRTSLNNLHRV